MPLMPTSTASTADPLPAGNTALARMIADFDWATTPLGARDDWPANLRAVVSLILQSPLPMVTLWEARGS